MQECLPGPKAPVEFAHVRPDGVQITLDDVWHEVRQRHPRAVGGGPAGEHVVELVGAAIRHNLQLCCMAGRTCSLGVLAQAKYGAAQQGTLENVESSSAPCFHSAKVTGGSLKFSMSNTSRCCLPPMLDKKRLLNTCCDGWQCTLAMKRSKWCQRNWGPSAFPKQTHASIFGMTRHGIGQLRTNHGRIYSSDDHQGG